MDLSTVEVDFGLKRGYLTADPPNRDTAKIDDHVLSRNT